MSSRETVRCLNRCVGLLCILLLAVTSTLELAHAHGSLTDYSQQAISADSQQGGPVSGCTLCVAGHSPAIRCTSETLHSAPAADPAVKQSTPLLRSLSLDFALAVRPPPAQD